MGDIRQEALSGIEDLDAATGLANCMGNPVLYVNLLLRFVSLHGQDADRMAERLDIAAMEDLKRMIHTLKGVSATLGATRIEVLCHALETEFHERTSLVRFSEQARVHLEELRVEMKRLVRALTAALAES